MWRQVITNILPITLPPPPPPPHLHQVLKGICKESALQPPLEFVAQLPFNIQTLKGIKEALLKQP